MLLICRTATVVVHLLLLAFNRLNPMDHILCRRSGRTVAEIDWHASCIELLAVGSRNQEEDVVAQGIGVMENTAEESGDCVNESATGQELVLAEEM